MKLYTEEEIKKRLLSLNVTKPDVFIEYLTPIELPSDDEIDKESHNHYLKGQLLIEPASDTEYAFKKGAKWMKEQILNQNK